MLSSLHIENIALIKTLSLEHDSGFCVFTGETGAGKSIIIDAINMLCGARSDRELIRTGEQYALVEGAFGGFSDDTLKTMTELELEPDEDGIIFLSRKLSLDGRAISKINGRTVPASRLRGAAERLICIHGQQDTRMLSDADSFIKLLDRFIDNREATDEYYKAYKQYTDIKHELNSVKVDEDEKVRRADYLSYRISEIENARLKVEEEEKLNEQKTRLLNAKKIVTGCSSAYNALYGAENKSASILVDTAYREVSSLLTVLPELNELAQKLKSIKYEIEDISETVVKYIDEDTGTIGARLDKIEERLYVIQDIKRKYGGSIEVTLENCEKMKTELQQIENADEYLAKLKSQLTEAEKIMIEKAVVLTAIRKEGAVSLAARIKYELEFLDMGKLQFVVEVSEKQPAPDGFDTVRFLVSTNIGEPPKPIEKIASGGELSRIMLSIMSVLSQSDSAGTIIFDEIDTGISGKTSRKIGIKLKGLTMSATPLQIICVTHSAQIAALADCHLRITKEEKDGRTYTYVNELDKEARIEELSRIIGGLNVSERIRAAAEELLEQTD
ncbi:MAG: DNA repair protein RecN [Clostridiales bacterium GWF2_38_85]|nr:MAG: DNA repair protein RecN [Clostridiales bacterium GWF2_38_85]HBL85419.1 DNA repair protein RecN [Clostridiales bacterium]